MTPAQMQDMLRNLTLKVDALATMGSGSSKGGARKTKPDKHVKVENKGIIMVNNNFFVLLSFKTTIARSTKRRTSLKDFSRDMRKP